MKKIKVLVVDDSALMRRIISDIISSEEGMEVIATGRNGLEAVEKTASLRPGLVLLDIEMPEMDGLTALTRIMKETPTPVVMVSAMDAKKADVVLESLERGAVDFVSKPQGKSITHFEDEDVRRLIAVVKSAVSANISLSKPVEVPKVPEITETSLSNPPVITIGASTGGPKSVREVLSYFPRDIPAYILVVQHMPPEFTRSFADRLAQLTGLNVVEARDGEPLTPGKVLVAPGDYHMVIEKVGTGYAVRLDKGEKVNNVRPSVDITMESVADVFGPNVIGVLLTGMGSDGAKGMSTIKEKYGKTIAEDASSCVIYGMPKAAIETGCVDHIVPLQGIPIKIMTLMT